MKRFVILLGGFILVASIALFAGCSDDDNDITGNNSTTSPKILSVSPTDGTASIPIGASISIKFDVPMDTMSVMDNFHLSGGDELHLWMDSLDHHQGSGGMGNMMNMNHMMNWMDSIHVGGDFHWNDSMDSCLYEPDSMMSNTDYMFFMNGDIMSHGGNMMDMDHLDYDGYMYHFSTGP